MKNLAKSLIIAIVALSSLALVACSGGDAAATETPTGKKAGDAPTSSSNADLRNNISLGGSGQGSGAEPASMPAGK